MLTTPNLGTPNLGTGITEERERVDFGRLRRWRRDRVFDAMDAAGIDACALGREANARYLTGVRRLWTAQSRPFSPTCLAVRATRQIHLLSFSASYEGVPAELAPDDVYPLSWNPMNVIERFRSIDGSDQFGRVGVDGMSPLFQQLLTTAFPKAGLVEMEPTLRSLRRVKHDDEITCIRTAAAVAEASLVAALDRLEPGVGQGELVGAAIERMCVLGTSQFSRLPAFGGAGPRDRPWWVDQGAVFGAGELVAGEVGALWAGYEGALVRTWPCGGRPARPDDHRRLRQRWQAIMAATVDALRPGATGDDLRAAHDAAGFEPTEQPTVSALGLGHEGPVAGPTAPLAARREPLVAGMVVAVRGQVADDELGYVAEDSYTVTDTGAVPITTLPHDPRED